MRRAPLLIAVLALAAPASAHAAGEAFMLLGAGPDGAPLQDGQPAAGGGVEDSPPVAALPDGGSFAPWANTPSESAKRFAGFLVGDIGSVWRVDAQGLLRRVAGTGETGETGDGGPAAKAKIDATSLAALPGGGFLIGEGVNQRVRMVDAAGTITTVAGGGRSRADGVPATQARLDEPDAVAALPGGGFLVADSNRLREVGPDGRIRTLAGGGRRDEPAHGQVATSLELTIGGVVPAADGSVLISNFREVDRVTADGRITAAFRGTDAHPVQPTLLTGLPDGSFAFVDDRYDAQTLDERNRIVRVAPDGSSAVVAGGGTADRADGLPGTALDIGEPGGLSATPDGGLLVGTELGFVAYLAPAAPAILGAALERDGARVFTPGRPASVDVALTLPATVSLRVAGRTITQALPAGVSRVSLGELTAREHVVDLAATDAQGRRAGDRARVFPRGWLPADVAGKVAVALTKDVSANDCRRLSAARVDCRHFTHPGCRMVSLRYSQERLRWGAYRGCEVRAHPRYTRAPGPLRRRDWHCGDEHVAALDSPCRPPWFGRVREARLIPTD
jgi:hypothetical protein